MKRIYIAGPMSGLPDLNYPYFNLVAAALRRQGHHVENPAENPESFSKSWTDCMRMAVRQLATCDTVVLLHNWELSKGACIEHRLAHDLGLKVVKADQVL
jgi:Domain of unknown function (DUF4406)